MNSNVEVIIVPPRVQGGTCKAKPINSNKRALEIWWTTKYPKASKQMTRMKRMQGSKWKAILQINKQGKKSYLAVERIMN